MNAHHIKTENEYIDSLIYNMNNIGYKDKKHTEKFQEIKNNDNILQESIKLCRKLLKLNKEQIFRKNKNNYF